jgi:hypothetical protein
MAVPRAYHTATLLADGRVLISGGDATGTTAEIYDPATGRFTSLPPAPAMLGDTAVRLLDGSVLFPGVPSVLYWP